MSTNQYLRIARRLHKSLMAVLREDHPRWRPLKRREWRRQCLAAHQAHHAAATIAVDRVFEERGLYD